MVHNTSHVANFDTPEQGKDSISYETPAHEYVCPKCTSNDTGSGDDLFCVDRTKWMEKRDVLHT